eukprot:6899075-Pyramimonas_sp.AAC.1
MSRPEDSANPRPSCLDWTRKMILHEKVLHCRCDCTHMSWFRPCRRMSASGRASDRSTNIGWTISSPTTMMRLTHLIDVAE